MVVLSFFGGAGVIVYIACWLLMPEDDRESSLAERAIARGGSNPWPVLVLAGVLGLVAVLSAGWVVDDRGLLLIALFVIAAILLSRRETEVRTGFPPAPTPPVAPASFAAPADTSWSAPADTSWSTPTGATAPLPPLAPADPPAPRSLLGRLTFCLVLLALGALATADLSGADIRAAAYPALVVAGAGLGLLVGSRYGRGRWLIALGVLGALALPPAVFADAYRGDWVDQNKQAITPTDVAGIAPEYSYRGGVVRLDLSGVNFTDQAVTTRIELGVGDTELIVPANVDVITDVDLGIGEAEVFGSEHNGLGVSERGRDDGADGPGGGTLTVEIEQGIGHVEVRRAAA
jgi:phage shock protein PspC (stress-responsive transcriptional regulator)